MMQKLFQMVRRVSPVLFVVYGFLLLGCQSQPHTWGSLYEALHEQKPEVYQNEGIKIARFAVIGELTTQGKTYTVTQTKGVLTGMLAPRAQNYYAFIDDDLRVAAHYHWNHVAMHWFEGSKVYLFGLQEVPGAMIDPRLTAMTPQDEAITGNILDFRGGLDHYVLTREKAYGFSGGIEDDPWER